MALINIPSTNDDPSYRYKMPRIVSKKECRGNGSKTCIVNMGDVARALKRPPQYTTKWFGYELGALASYTKNDREGERAVLRGHHETSTFQGLLDKFISKYVCCEGCHLPEIDMRVKKGDVVGKCMACGWLGSLDNAHKLAAYITKNPPDESGHNLKNEEDEEGGGKKDKKERRAEKAAARAAAAEGDDDEDVDDDDSDDKPVKEKKEKKDKKDKKDKKEKKEKKKQADDDDDDDEDGEKKAKKEKKEKKDKKDKKDKKEKKEKKEKKQKGSDDDSDDGDKSGDNSADKDDQSLKFDDPETKDVVGAITSLVESKGGKAKAEDIFEEVRMHQLAKLFDHKVRLYIVLVALCGDKMDAKSLATHKKVVTHLIENGKMPAADILWTFDAYLSQNSAAQKGFPMVLKAIYDEEWVGEPAILAYYNEDEGSGEPGFDEAKKSAAPFLKWLATAGSDDDDSDDDDDESDD
eukprot:CAMPEP_0195096900 /NCGR_PEP_ID=MMETSP0448-20130528/51818_1 /TAXON_ID=66468 /ORGANISM="Heterocapsa triquestra, Strain CCMP 448" /LENGTH=464 /DNA_ID=CAMNT_0040131347 /DNA_START=149 /DNA_END=1543 /DNA_ORIENTATION=-